jgi:hypothetical protein
MTGMMSRTPFGFEQTLADPHLCATQGYAQQSFLARVVRVTRQSICFVCSSSHNDAPSCDGQLASSPARLPVFFWQRYAQRREPVGHFGVVHLNNSLKGSTSWVIPKSLLHSLRLRVCPPAATLWASKHWAGVSSAPALQLSRAGALRRARLSAPLATSSLAKLIWLIATDLIAGLRPLKKLQQQHHAGLRLRGVLRFTNLFHHHKGPAYV